MKKFFKRIYSHRYFLLFIMLFAYADSIYGRISVGNELNVYIFTPEAFLYSLINVGILFPLIIFFINRWQKSAVFSAKEILKIFSSSITVFILVLLLLKFAMALAFGGVERNFDGKQFPLGIIGDLLDGFIYGSFFLAYYYFLKNKNYQEQLATYNKALSESRINQLKTQLNPHFLFNNLNVLDQLIDEDKSKASDFLNKFADIYRYVLHASDKKLIPIREEMEFAEQYFGLIKYKYGNAYQLCIEKQNMDGFISPLTFQLLIENAVQHNLGTEENPVYIHITANQNLTISNNLIPKRNMKQTSGRALVNLAEQYRLLANKPIEIQKSDNIFSVSIPTIDTVEQ